MDSLRLVIPSEEYFASYLEMIEDLSAEHLDIGEPHIDILQKKDFRQYEQKVKDDSLGIGLPQDWVPATLFWAIVGRTVVGRIQLRHRLPAYGGHIGYAVASAQRGKGYAKQMLALCLPEARRLGIAQVHLTCDKSNVASQAVMRANGAQLLREFVTPAGTERLEFCIAM